MDSDDKKKLDRLLQLAEENNEYIRQVRRSQKTSQMYKAIWWVIGITLTLSAVYAFKPYLGTIEGAYGLMHGATSTSTPTSVPSMAQLQALYDQYKAGTATTTK